MIGAFDVDYRDRTAVAAGIVFQNWEDDTPLAEYVVRVETVAEYMPGRFYLRELPCTLAVLKKVDYKLRTIVIDGYVHLGREEKPGLGDHLHDALNHKIPIIGVAKTAFAGTQPSSLIFRGNSTKPLYITSKGVALETAKTHLLKMHGNHRIPTLLKWVDRLCRRADVPL